MGQYANQTQVSSEKSKAEIERVVMRYGADQFLSGMDLRHNQGMVSFRMADRLLRFVLPLPDPESDEFTETATGRERALNQARQAWEQACRQRWRALKLVIQAKLEAVECGIGSFDAVFATDIVLPDGRTAGEYISVQLPELYANGGVPTDLPGLLPSGLEE